MVFCLPLKAQPFLKQTLEVKGATALAAGDVDQDRQPELLVATVEGLHLLKMHNNGWQTVWQSAEAETPQASAAVYLLDLNADGRSDIIALDNATADDETNGTQHAIWLQTDGLQFDFLETSFPSETPSPSKALAWRYNNQSLELFLAGEYGEAHQLFGTNDAGPFSSTQDWLPGAGVHATAAAWLDLDADRDPDLATANYNGEDLFLRNFASQGSNVVVQLPRVTSENTPAAAAALWGDVNGDSLPDVYIPTYQGERDRFFLNQGDFVFSEQTDLPFTTAESWSTGGAWLDLENNGDLDLIRADNFAGLVVYRNHGNLQFTQLSSTELGDLASDTGFGGALVKGDWNDDGKMDLAYANSSGALTLFYNQNPAAQNYLQLELQLENGAPAYGAHVILPQATQSLIGGSSSPGGQDFPLMHFGLGTVTTVDQVQVYWPDGQTEIYRNLVANQKLALMQDKAEEQTELIYPWVSNNNGQFESTLYAANLRPAPVSVSLTATRGNGQSETVSRTIAANGFLEASAAELFPNLGSGPGYHVRLRSPFNGITGRWVTFNRTSGSGASPSQGVAINREAAANDLAQIGRKLLFSYLPVQNGFISSPVLINLGERQTGVSLSFFTEDETLGGYFIESLAPGVPFAQVTTSLTTTARDYVMCLAESNIEDITGVGFVFNSVFGEAAIGNASVPQTSGNLGGDLIFPWINNNAGNFESVLVLNNTSSAPMAVTLTATRANGSQETVDHTLQPSRVFARRASELFAELGSGTGYSVRVQHLGDTAALHGSWVTNTLTAPSGGSPSMGVAVHSQQQGGHKRAGSKLFLGFLPGDASSFSAAVVVNTGDQPTNVRLSFYNRQGNLIEQQSIQNLAPLRPWANTTQVLLGSRNENVYVIAESDQELLTGVTFVFNQRGEPSIGNAQAIP